MGTAIVVAIVSGLVSIASVIANYRITRKNSVEETTRARDARKAEDARAAASREAEDRRLREARDAEAQRREDERTVARASQEAAAQSKRTAERWEAVRKVIGTEAQVVGDPAVFGGAYRLLLQSLSLLTHPEEKNLRGALRQRGLLTNGPVLNVVAQVQPQWWHPWVSEWATHPQVPMIYGEADEGRVF